MRATNLDPNDNRVRTAVFGQQVQDFLATEIGAFLLKRAESELATHIESLKTWSASDSLGIMALQGKIRLLESFEAWLGDAVQDGLTAIAVIDGEEDHHAEEG